MEEVLVEANGDDSLDLPPGFRFHPTDEEIITHYLSEKVMNSSFSARAIGEVDLNKCEPWDLPKKAKMGEKEWYFFCQRDRKYPTGMRTNRATESGYWKATGKDKELYKGKGCLVGMKKTLVFYRGRAPKGEKTNWVMHEFRLEGKFSYYNLPKTAKDDWVVCRIFHKNTGVKRSPITGLPRMNSFGDDLILYSPSLPPLMDPPYLNSNRPGSNFMDGAESSLRASDGNCSTGMVDHHLHEQDQHKSFLQPNNYQGNQLRRPPPNSTYYPHQIPLPNPPFSFQGSSNSGYLHQDWNNLIPRFPNSGGFSGPADQQAILRALAATNDASSLIRRQCKVEPFSSNQSMVSLSQDTGLSTDINTEISSVVSKHDLGRSYEELDGTSSAGPVEDFVDCLWNYTEEYK